MLVLIPWVAVATVILEGQLLWSEIMVIIAYTDPCQAVLREQVLLV
jgi:hypothetical protein